MKYKIIALAVLLLLGLSIRLPAGSASSSKIQWHSYKAGMAQSKLEKKKVFLHFFAKWCVYCKQMEQKTFRDPGVIAALNQNFIPIKVDVDREKSTSAMFRIRGLPDSWFIAEDGNIIGHRPGYISANQLKTIFKMVLDQGSGGQ